MGKTLKEAQRDFELSLQAVDPKSIPAFLQWIGDTFLDDSATKPKYIEDANLSLREMAQHIKLKVPVASVLPSERVACPKQGHDADCKEEITVNVDCFLYEDDDVDELVKEGKLSRSYCADCNGRNVKPLTFISHSLSVPQLEFMFTKLVPLVKKPEGFRVLDIGSRFGSICAAALLYSRGKAHATGIELNADLCKLQEDLIASFKLANVDIVNADVRSQAEIIARADVIVMNNVFSFFMSEEEEVSCWSFLHAHFRPGTLLIHNPSIHLTTAHLKLPFDLDQWLKPKKIRSLAADFASGDEDLFEDLSTLHLYEVLPSSPQNE